MNKPKDTETIFSDVSRALLTLYRFHCLENGNPYVTTADLYFGITGMYTNFLAYREIRKRFRHDFVPIQKLNYKMLKAPSNITGFELTGGNYMNRVGLRALPANPVSEAARKKTPSSWWNKENALKMLNNLRDTKTLERSIT